MTQKNIQALQEDKSIFLILSIPFEWCINSSNIFFFCFGLVSFKFRIISSQFKILVFQDV